MFRRVELSVPWLLAGALLLSGCETKPATPAGSKKEQTSARPSMAEAATPATETAAPVQDLKPGETWDINFLQGQRVGYGHSSVRRITENGQEVLRTEKKDHLAIRRAGQTSVQEMRTLSIETLDGKLLRFESELQMGTKPTRMTGRVNGDRVDVEILGPRAKTPKTLSIKWSDDYLGPFAIEQIVLRRPMRPGERRVFKMLMCGFDSVDVIDVAMKAQDWEEVKLPNGSEKLLRIDTTLSLPGGGKMDGIVWANRAGETLKQSAAGLDIYRSTKAEALDDKAATSDLKTDDVMANTSVKLSRPLNNPHHAKQLRYKVHLDSGYPWQVFSIGPTQSVKQIDENTAEITVYAIRPGDKGGNRDALADPPTATDRTPNNFVQSDDPVVVAFADRAVGEEKDPWKTAVALERFVRNVVKNKDFTQGFASAAEVARSLEGDCTEHAVLLCAMARAKGLPARVAIGLVYLESRKADGTSEPTFFYHMWTEVYIDDRWVPIDGTLGQGGIGAGHLKIGQSNLQGASVYGAFLPVLNVIGKLKIEPIDGP